MATVQPTPAISPAAPRLSQITPLNEQRRDEALYLLAQESEREMTQYDVCKVQVLADTFHVIDTGRVIFGGELVALRFGPLISSTLDACGRWALGAVAAAAVAAPQGSGERPPLELVRREGRDNNIAVYRASLDPWRAEAATWESFAEPEEVNIRRAFRTVLDMPSWKESQRYFHEPISAIGYAWEKATRPYPKPLSTRVAMNWFDVLDGAESVDKTDVGYARSMLRLWVE